jgi:DNA-binding NarL/FixJ family response regulator
MPQNPLIPRSQSDWTAGSASFAQTPIRILLVDDQPRVRQGWRMALSLEADMEVVGEAADGEEAVRRASTLQPAVVVMDVEMALMDGIEATRVLRGEVPTCAVIVVSIHDTEQIRSDALAAGAAAFISKQDPIEALLVAIRQCGADPHRSL